MTIPFACPVCGKLDAEGIDGHITSRCAAVTRGVTKSVVTCNQCVTKDKEIERLRNQLAISVAHLEEWKKVTGVEKSRKRSVDLPKRDRAEYMRKFRERKSGAKEAV